jgi:hypothetical protein
MPSCSARSTNPTFLLPVIGTGRRPVHDEAQSTRGEALGPYRRLTVSLPRRKRHPGITGPRVAPEEPPLRGWPQAWASFASAWPRGAAIQPRPLGDQGVGRASARRRGGARVGENARSFATFRFHAPVAQGIEQRFPKVPGRPPHSTAQPCDPAEGCAIPRAWSQALGPSDWPAMARRGPKVRGVPSAVPPRRASEGPSSRNAQ